jgi:hypothetical protein
MKTNNSDIRNKLDLIVLNNVITNGLPEGYTSLEELFNEINKIHSEPCCSEAYSSSKNKPR